MANPHGVPHSTKPCKTLKSKGHNGKPKKGSGKGKKCGIR